METLHIYRKGRNGPKTIRSADKKATLHTFVPAKLSGFQFVSKPHVKIYQGSLTAMTAAIGSINFECSLIVVTLPNMPTIIMRSGGTMSKLYEYESGGRAMKWKQDGFFSRGDLVCEDGVGNLFAKLRRKSILSFGKVATLEVTERGNGAMLLEIVAGAVALIELRKKLDRDSVKDVDGGTFA